MSPPRRPKTSTARSARAEGEHTCRNRLPDAHRLIQAALERAGRRGRPGLHLRRGRQAPKSRAWIAAVSVILILAALLLPGRVGIPRAGAVHTWDTQAAGQAVPTATTTESTRRPDQPSSEPATAPPATPIPQPTAEPTQPPTPQPTEQSADPPRAAASARGGSRPTPDISTPEKFIAAVAEAAQDSQRDSKVPASVTIAQAILESDWGRSALAKKANNFFGIKATSGPGPAGIISMSTWEVLSGRNVTVQGAFRAYHNLYESVMDHGRFLADNPRYAAAFQALDDVREFARRIQAAGYATDPAYSTKLINLMDKFNLYQYDLPQP